MFFFKRSCGSTQVIEWGTLVPISELTGCVSHHSVGLSENHQAGKCFDINQSDSSF